MTSRHQIYSVLKGTVLIFLVVGIVQSAPMPTALSHAPETELLSSSSWTTATTETTSLKSSSSSSIRSQDADIEFDMHLPTRPNFQRMPSHRSNDALKNLFENSRTTEETNKPQLLSSTITANIIPETETATPRGGEDTTSHRERGEGGNENFNDHYYETSTTSKGFGYDVGTTQYIGASSSALTSSTASSLPSNSEEVHTQTTTYFIVKTTTPTPVRSSYFKDASSEGPTDLSMDEKDAVLSAIKAATVGSGAPVRALDFESDTATKTTNTPSNLRPLTAEPSLLPTTSSQESETTINSSDRKKIDSKSMDAKTTKEATTIEREALSESTIVTTSGTSVPLQSTTESSPGASSVLPPKDVISTTLTPATPQAAIVATNSPKSKTKINKGLGAGKGASSISKKKSGITIMGHDGVKVTRKKQLLEKSYRDDIDMVVAMTTAATGGPTTSLVETVEVGKSHKVMEPMAVATDEATLSSTSAPITADSTSTSTEGESDDNGGHGNDSAKETTPATTLLQVPTEMPKDSSSKGSDAMEIENELWNGDDSKKNYFEANRVGSTEISTQSTESLPSASSRQDHVGNFDGSSTNLPTFSSFSAVTESTLSSEEISIHTKVTSTSEITTEAFSETSTIPSGFVGTTQSENITTTSFADASEVARNSSIPSSTAEVSNTPSSLGSIRIPTTPLISTASAQPKVDFLNETHILVVEITSADNSTDDVVSNEDSAYNGNSIPKFTIHNDGISEYDSGNTRPYGTGVEIDYENSKSQADDDLFVPDLKLEPIEDIPPVTVSTKEKNVAHQRETIDRDSDTIFYISNTEVKVVESKPTQNSNVAGADKASSDFNSNYESHRPNGDTQYYPAIYEEDVIIDFPAKNVTFSVTSNQAAAAGKDDEAPAKSERYEEDIILSPLKNNFDPLKIIANHNNGVSEQKQSEGLPATASLTHHANPLSLENNPSLTYIGEKLIEVEPSQTDSPITFPDPNPNNSEAPLEVNESLVPISDVIIQPAIIPEMSIGVPVIGELPPQIELREIDFLADSPVSGSGISSGGSGTFSNAVNDPSNEKFDGIQYGGDLFARDASVLTGGPGYDMDTEYVFGGRRHTYNNNPNGFSPLNDPIKVNRDKNRNNGRNMGSGYDGNNDVTVASKIFMHAVDNLQKDQLIAEVRSGFKELSVRQNMNANGTGSAETNLTNATAYSVMEDADGDLFNFTDMQTLFLACFATLVPLILCVLLAFGLRYLWRKYRPGPSVSGLMGDNSTDPLATKSMTMSQDEDISRDARETKMHYTPSEKDGVFVVEVARGADSTGIPGSPRNASEARTLNHTVDIEKSEKTSRNDSKPTNHEEVQIHQPPRDGEANEDKVIAEVEESRDSNNAVSLKCDPEPLSTNLANSNTGLSQSDLSTSSADSNKGYTYGNQQLYTVETKGYRPPSPKMGNLSAKVSPMKCENDETDMANENCSAPVNKKPDPETKPIITAALLKQDTVSEINDNYSSQGQKSSDNNASSKENGTETFDVNNVPNSGTLSSSSSHNNEPKSLSCNNKNNDSCNNPDPRDGQQQIENGEITPVTDNNNGHKNEIEPTTEKVHENGTGNSQENGTVIDVPVDDINDVENGFDSIISLPPPPPTSEEIKQLNDVILMENNQLDSLPPPPPPVDSQSQILNHEATTINGHTTMEGQNGVAVVITGAS
ncbi:serine-rich adhesin for platelets isoform X2 [Hermetia illucens]|uniref:serine-rich adhesin for platelets isoform X2 n=1 Tax=Hermetia illucens TaxID=343691 RepID=UPI0018CC26D1|nr:serine-rich adhesin for platelets isoform X2 [Hermetia illucens]